MQAFSKLFIDGARLNDAIAALRKARATLTCNDDYYSGARDAFTASPGCEGNAAWCEPLPRHPDIASALLDGFSVDEVTLAGG